MVDRATGWVEMVATPDHTCQSAIRSILSEWVPRYGVPKTIVSDNGTHFTSKEFGEACAEYKIHGRTVVPYHPQANGLVERRFRDMNRAVRILATVERDWEDVLPQFLFSTRNLANSVTGFSPAELVFGEKIRTPLTLDGNFNRYYNQGTELERTLYRLNLAEQVVADKKLILFQRTSEVAGERFEIKDYEVGQEVYTYVDELPKGTIKREFIPWEGPFVVKEVRKMNIVVDKQGISRTLNKTKCIRIRPLQIPPRSLDGKVAEEDKEFEEQQRQVMKDKIRYLKKKISSGEAAALEATSSEPEKKKEVKKVMSGPVPRKIAYEARDFQEGDMVIVYLKEKKGNYLARVLKVWLPEDQKWETEKWIRIHLWGKTGDHPETYSPWWIDSKKRCYLEKKGKMKVGELWEDVYAATIRYRLTEPMKDGRIHKKDIEAMTQVWGHSLHILSVEVR